MQTVLVARGSSGAGRFSKEGRPVSFCAHLLTSVRQCPTMPDMSETNGRPRREVRTTVRLFPLERETIDRAAAARDRQLSDWMRRVLLEAAERDLGQGKVEP